ncbi:MAG: L,D-transpeptidase family protein [Candidatus Omnitrophica bacterium]|nr:L,D-transpeptidase family protein [Candidatus Omnitrophota bacterium]
MKNRNVMIAGIAVIVIAIVWVGLLKKKEVSNKSNEVAVASTTKSVSAHEMYKQAEELQKTGKPEEAKKLYQNIMTEHPDFEQIENVQTQVGALNIEQIFSKKMIEGKTTEYEIMPGDSLVKVAKKFKTTVPLLRRSNGLKGDTIRLGQKLRVWTGTFTILVNKSQNTLMLKDGNDVVKVYKVSTGKENSTPVGIFKIVLKQENPVWFSKEGVFPPESPDNQLGSRWMGFNIESYGIHGTIAPEKLGEQATAGCVRMLNADVEELYDIIPTGTEVTIVN